MSSVLRNLVSLSARRALGAVGLRIINVRSDKVRGFEPFRDVAALLGGNTSPVVFDVGANDGETTEVVLKMFPRAEVFVFEPYPPCCMLLEKKFRDVHGVSIYNVGLGAERKTITLNTYS